MNLSNTVAVVVFEAWRQNGLPAAPDTARVPALQLVRAHFGQQLVVERSCSNSIATASPP
jgi:hypothetical protein